MYDVRHDMQITLQCKEERNYDTVELFLDLRKFEKVDSIKKIQQKLVKDL